jgi:hypothetical protein
MYDTEQKLLTAASLNKVDRVAQRALKLRTQIRQIGRTALARHDDDQVNAMVMLHFSANMALLGMHATGNYGFMHQEILAQRKEGDPEDSDPFSRLPMVNEVSVEEATELLDECEEALKHRERVTA